MFENTTTTKSSTNIPSTIEMTTENSLSVSDANIAIDVDSVKMPEPKVMSSSRKSALGVLLLLSLFLSDRRTDNSLQTSSSAVRLGQPSGTSPLKPGPDRKKQTLANVSSAH